MDKPFGLHVLRRAVEYRRLFLGLRVLLIALIAACGSERGQDKLGRSSQALEVTWDSGATLEIIATTPTSITFQWTAAFDDGDAPNYSIIKYRIYDGATLHEEIDVTPSGVCTPNGCIYTYTGLTTCQTHTFKVEAGNSGGHWSTTGPSASGAMAIGSPATSAPPLDRFTATEFAPSNQWIFSGTDALQTGVSSGSGLASTVISAPQVSVVRGKVTGSDGTTPESCVTVSVVDHPEYGNTITLADGTFFMAVNAPFNTRLHYEKASYIPVERQLTAVAHSYVWAPAVSLTSYSATVKAITPGSTSWQYYDGDTSPAEGGAGARTAHILFPPSTSIVRRNSDDTTTTLSSDAHISATELTIGPNGIDKMPATLPPQSAYTYAVELTASEVLSAGAKGLEFSNSLDNQVFFYTDNFLSFNVGESVPSGYYDHGLGVWTTAPSGQVIKVRAVDGSGHAIIQLVDGTDASSTDLAAIDMTDDERTLLASMYTTLPTTLWRVGMTHFSLYDLNGAYGCPTETDGGCPAPNQPPPVAVATSCSSIVGGSIIECDNHNVGEEIAIAGTPYKLTYRSGHQQGRAAAIHVNLTAPYPAIVPVDLNALILEVQIGGGVIDYELIPAISVSPGMERTVYWDGKDAAGRYLQGPQNALVKIGYRYNSKYQSTKSFGDSASGTSSGGGGGGGAMLERPLAIIWQNQSIEVSRWDDAPMGLGGWRINAQHGLARDEAKVYKGDGTEQTGKENGSVITTAVGSCANAFISPPTSPSSGPASQPTPLSAHPGLAFGPDGLLYYTEPTYIRRVSPSGDIVNVAGGTTTCAGSPYGDGNDALTSVCLIDPVGLAFGNDGSLFGGNQVGTVRKISAADGIIRGVMGIWSHQSLPDGSGGGALAAHLDQGDGQMIVGPDGTLYVSDYSHNCIRKLAPDGTFGNLGLCGGAGTPGAGDGLPINDPSVTTAVFNQPTGLAMRSDGTLFIADRGHHQIRKISPSGILSTYAGNTTGGNTGDGLNIVDPSVAFDDPDGLALTWDGALFVSDSAAHVIRRISPDGIISRVAGLGLYATDPAPDGSNALQVRLAKPTALAMGPDNTLYFIESRYNCIRRLSFVSTNSSGGESYIPSADGQEVWYFDAAGRHVRTVDALTNLVIRELGYDSTYTERLVYIDEVVDRTASPVTKDRTQFTYDGYGNLTAIIPPRGGQTTIGMNGYISSVQNPAGETITLDYTSFDGMLYHFIDAKSQSHELTYDGYGALLKDAEPTAAGGYKTLTPTYSLYGWSTDVTTAMGRVKTKTVFTSGPGETRDAYDQAGLKTTSLKALDGSLKVTHPDGSYATTTFIGDPRFGVSALSPYLTTVHTAATGLSYSVSTSKAATFTSTSPTPDPAYLASYQTTTSYSDGVTSASFTTTYTRASNTIVDTLPVGSMTVTRTLDANGRLASLTVPGMNVVHYVYDSLGRRTLTWSSDPTGVTGCDDPGATPSPITGCRRSISTYDATSGYLASLVDNLGNAASFTRDAVGRTSWLSLPSLDGTSSTRTVGLSFDLNGNVTGVTTPTLIAASPVNPHVFTFDSVDRPATYSAPDIAPAYTSIARTSTTDYNLDGQPTLVSLPSGGAIHFYYEGDSTGSLPTPNPNTGRLKRIAHGSGTIDLGYGDGSPVTTNSGRLTSLTGPLSSTSITYDWDGSIATTAWETAASTHSLKHAYDAYLRVASAAIDGTPAYATYSYDALNALTGVTLSSGNPSLTIFRDSTTNRVASTSIGSTWTATDHYDSINGFGELMGYSAQYYSGTPPSTPQYSLAFERDGTGRVHQKTEVLSSSTKVLGYTYYAGGALHEVKDVAGGWPGTTLFTYAYDANGNRLTKTVGSSSSPTSAVYDSQDRLISYEGSNTYTYNDDGQLTSKTVSGDTTTYTYDNLGNLLQVDQTYTGGVTIDYVVDGAGRRIGKKVGGVLKKEWIYDGSRIIAEWDIPSGAVSKFIYAAKANVPDVMVRLVGSTTTAYRIISDYLGSVRMVVNLTTGAVDQQITYDDDGFGGVSSMSGTSNLQPFGFAGGHYDYQTSLTRFGARDSDPEVGRWTAKDPSRFHGGIGLFVYASNDPINYVDKYGRNPVAIATWAGEIAGSIAATVYTIGVLHQMYDAASADSGDIGDAGIDVEGIVGAIANSTGRMPASEATSDDMTAPFCAGPSANDNAGDRPSTPANDNSQGSDPKSLACVMRAGIAQQLCLSQPAGLVDGRCDEIFLRVYANCMASSA